MTNGAISYTPTYQISLSYADWSVGTKYQKLVIWDGDCREFSCHAENGLTFIHVVTAQDGHDIRWVIPTEALGSLYAYEDSANPAASE